MAVSLYSFVDLYSRALTTASHLLNKGLEHAKATGVGEAEMLDWRLIEDMAPLRFQLMVVCNFTRQWPARVADLPPPADVAMEMTAAEFQAAIADAKRYLAALTPAQFEGRDEVPLAVEIGGGSMKPTLPAGQWLTVFSTTNLYFHLSTAYGILRAHGVRLSKPDLFAGGL
jgi:hypothetical protein